MPDTTMTMDKIRDSMEQLRVYATAQQPIFNILENPFLVVDGESYEVPRTWKERLFTLPWHPFKRTKTIIPKVPNKNVYFANNGTVCIAHPETARIIREKLKDIRR